MNRRSFIRISTHSGVVLLGGQLFSSCAPDTGIAYDPWAGPSSLLNDEDVRLRIVSYGLLSPSFKNAQPWWVSIKGPGIDVSTEEARISPDIDPQRRQSMISIGAFIETISIASSSYGFDAFSTLVKDPSSSDHSPVSPRAHIALKEQADRATDPLFGSLLTRRTNRTRFSEKRLEQEAVSAIENAGREERVRFLTVDEQDVVSSLSGVIMEVAQDTFKNPDSSAAELRHLRLTAGDVRSLRDGITLENAGFSPVARAIYGIRSSIFGEDPESLRSGMLDLLTVQTDSAAAYGALVAEDDSTETRLSVGRAFMRIHLAATKHGVALQPFSLATESSGAQQDLQNILNSRNNRVHLLFRLGYADGVAASARRSLFEVVRI